MDKLSLHTIITGGQSGGDLAGNKFAVKQRIPTHVNICPGFQPIRPQDHLFFAQLSQYIVTPLHGIDGLRARTRYNVENSDVTIIFIQRPLNQTRGSRLTSRICDELEKEKLVVELYKERPIADAHAIQDFLFRQNPEILNIAGERWIVDVLEIDRLERAWKIIKAEEKK